MGQVRIFPFLLRHFFHLSGVLRANLLAMDKLKAAYNVIRFFIQPIRKPIVRKIFGKVKAYDSLTHNSGLQTQNSLGATIFWIDELLDNSA